MNLFLDYQVKILSLLKKLKKKNIINLPSNLSGIVVELPPKKQDATMSCNAAMILAKTNQKTASEIAEILKKYFLNNFNEFEKIDYAKPGFLNIFFKNDFWKTYLRDIIKQGSTYGANKISKKKIQRRICFCQSNWTFTCRPLQRRDNRRCYFKFVKI